MERKIDNYREARLKEISGYYSWVVVTYDRERRGEIDQKYYTDSEYDLAYRDFMSRK